PGRKRAIVRHERPLGEPRVTEDVERPAFVADEKTHVVTARDELAPEGREQVSMRGAQNIEQESHGRWTDSFCSAPARERAQGAPRAHRSSSQISSRKLQTKRASFVRAAPP